VKLRLPRHVIFVLLLVLSLADCGGHKQTSAKLPPPPAITQPPPPTASATPRPAPGKKEATGEEDENQQRRDALSFPAGAKPILVDTGMASWYGAPYHNRRGSNGEIYNMNAMTAAHRTLPLGSIVRVTNVKTGHWAIVRITDRGPFVEGRILDLSLAAAKKVDVWQPGIAAVRMEVLRTPVSIDDGGRWAVQIGAFGEGDAAHALADRLSRRYRTSRVLCFSSPVGDWWVRIRVRDDDRKRAEEVVHDAQTAEASTFLVRLD
jgi:peptidoglycan lytic transglycosylase